MSGSVTGPAVAGRAPASSPALQAEAAPRESASVLVEVGCGKGALVLYLGDSFSDGEVEINRVGCARRVHTGILDRRTPAGVVRAAVFGSLEAARYVVWRDATTPAGSVVVSDGRVTELLVPQ